MDKWRAVLDTDSNRFILYCAMECVAIACLVSSYLRHSLDFSTVCLWGWVLLNGIYGHMVMYVKYCVPVCEHEEPLVEVNPDGLLDEPLVTHSDVTSSGIHLTTRRTKPPRTKRGITKTRSTISGRRLNLTRRSPLNSFR